MHKSLLFFQCVQYLLHAGALVNRRSIRGNTALHDAAEAGSVPIVRELLAFGAYTQRDGHQLTPIMAAALLGREAVVQYLAIDMQLNVDEQLVKRIQWKQKSQILMKA